MDNTDQQVDVYKTIGEWDAIEKRLKAIKAKSITTYVRYQAMRLTKQFNECEECVTVADGIKKRRTFYIDTETKMILKLVSKKMKKPIASVVDELIITPLLNNK